MLYLICSMIPGVNLERYGDLVLKTWESKKCATKRITDVSKFSKLSIDIFLKGKHIVVCTEIFQTFKRTFYCKVEAAAFTGDFYKTDFVAAFFSSPEPKAPGGLIGWEASVVRPSSVHTFKRLLL